MASGERGDAPTPDELLELRAALWKAMSDNAREQFTWPFPKAPVGTRMCQDDADGDGVAANFVYGLVVPNYVDHLVLRGTPQKRFVHYFKGDDVAKARAMRAFDVDSDKDVDAEEHDGWVSVRVNP